MAVIAFAGPSLRPEDRLPFPDVEWRPPAEAGDLLRLKLNPAARICLIDGYFDHRPAVRHKEILLLLSKGVAIFGGSSIGALRAAEMADFGMVGVGAIYRAYRSARITGDDEVALIHGPSDWHWRPLSLPMVDVRATLHRAVRNRRLEAPAARELLSAAAGIHYVDRSWDEILARLGLGGSLSRRLRRCLDGCEVPQKRIDAQACLKAAAEGGAAVPRPSAVRTVFLEVLAAECGAELEGRLPSRSRKAAGANRGAPHAETGCG
jgi:hypothetical protein